MILDRGMIVLDPSEVAASEPLRRDRPLAFLVDVCLRLLVALAEREDP